MVDLSGYGYVIWLAIDELALTEAYPSDLRQEDTVVADLKALWIPEAILALPSLLEYGETLRIGLIEGLIDGVGQGFECLLECLGWGIGQKLVFFIPYGE